ncbi:ATPase, T2SS/T4P/T4SS family [Paenibacillus sp. NRS-1783]|uniref:ATPase, T2SS/T4P/T4SS family n=1 Tax=Paenibacillus sp. NRS-1783 TaxID=3233907 RepID=UPI003D2CE0C5
MSATTKTITISNLGGGDNTEAVNKLLAQLPKGARSIVVEFPCLSIPRMAYTLQDIGFTSLTKEQTINELILDYDRKVFKDFKEYVYSKKTVDYLLIDIRSQPENPIIQNVSSNQTLLELPLQLKLRLKGHYDYVFFVTQGTISHPMTHFALRCADAAVLYSASSIDFVQNYTNYSKLKEYFSMPKERLFLFTADSQIGLKEEKIYTRYPELIKRIDELELVDDSSFLSMNKPSEENTGQIGVIDPLEYLNHQFSQTDIEIGLVDSESKMLEDLIDMVRAKLIEKHQDEYIRSLTNEHERQKIRYYISDIVRTQKEYLFSTDVDSVIERVQRDITELIVFQDLLDDDEVSSIEANSFDKIIYEKNGQVVHDPNLKFQSMEQYRRTIDKMLLPIGKPISSTVPVIDANYKGFRICVVADNKEYAGLSANAPLLSIRKFPPAVYDDDACIAYGNISQEIADFLRFITPCGPNILVAGSTNSGKTAQIIRFPLYLDPKTRVISLEDSEEMMLDSKEQYSDYPNLPSLLVKDVEDAAKSYGINKLLKTTLRLNPTVSLIGEIRDESTAKEYLNAINNGNVVWGTTHAPGLSGAATRILQLNGSTLAAASQLAEHLNLIYFQRRMKNGIRVLAGIGELVRYDGVERPIINVIFKYNRRTGQHVFVNKLKTQGLLEKIEYAERPDHEIERWCDMEVYNALIS